MLGALRHAPTDARLVALHLHLVALVGHWGVPGSHFNTKMVDNV